MITLQHRNEAKYGLQRQAKGLQLMLEIWTLRLLPLNNNFCWTDNNRIDAENSHRRRRYRHHHRHHHRHLSHE